MQTQKMNGEQMMKIKKNTHIYTHENHISKNENARLPFYTHSNTQTLTQNCITQMESIKKIRI